MDKAGISFPPITGFVSSAVDATLQDEKKMTLISSSTSYWFHSPKFRSYWGPPLATFGTGREETYDSLVQKSHSLNSTRDIGSFFPPSSTHYHSTHAVHYEREKKKKKSSHGPGHWEKVVMIAAYWVPMKAGPPRWVEIPQFGRQPR